MKRFLIPLILILTLIDLRTSEIYAASIPANLKAETEIKLSLSISPSGPPLSFGYISLMPKSTASTFILGFSNNISRTKGNDIYISGATSGTYIITGYPGEKIIISIPKSIQLTPVSGRGENLKFDPDVDQEHPVLNPATGTATVHIGGTLTIPDKEIEGVYQGKITITANYG